MAPRILQILFRLEALRDRSSNAGDWYTERWASAALDAVANAQSVEQAEQIESAVMRELKWLYSAAADLVERCFRGGSPHRARLAATLILVTNLAIPAFADDRCNATPRPADCPPHEHVDKPEKQPDKVTVTKIDKATTKMQDGSDFTFNIEVYRKETTRPDGSVKVEFYRDADLKQPIDAKMNYEMKGENKVGVEMEIAGSKSEFEIEVGEGGGTVEGTTTGADGSETTWKGDLHDDGNGKTMSGDMTGTEKKDGQSSSGTAHVIYDKVTGEILQIDPLSDPTVDS